MGLCSTTLGFVVLAAKLMDRGRADIIDANIHVDHLTPEGGHNAQPRACAGAHTPAHKIASNNTESSESNPKECRVGGGGVHLGWRGCMGTPEPRRPPVGQWATMSSGWCWKHMTPGMIELTSRESRTKSG